MNCWICGGDGTTGEHLAKASDLKAIFRKATQQKPIFFNTNSQRNIRVSSIKRSRHLKSSALICPYCNNVRTAPYDRAWEKLSTYLRGKKPAIRKGDIIKLGKIFPGAARKSMLDVHLFFVKLFGCAIIEYDISIDIAGFSNAIMNQESHPKVFLAFSPLPDFVIKNHVGRSNLELESIGGKCMYATWFYIVGSIVVNIIYAEPSEHRKGLIYAWHPSTVSKTLHICQV